MSLKLYAKNINNLTDARYFAAWMIDGIFYDFSSEEQRGKHLTNYLLIKEWVEGPERIGVFSEKMQDDLIFEYFNKLELQGIAFSDGFRKLNLADANHYVWSKGLSNEEFVGQNLVLGFNQSYSDLSDVQKVKLKTLCGSNQVILDIAVKLEELKQIIEELEVYGLVFSGGEEERVGVKDFDALDEIFEWLEEKG